MNKVMIKKILQVFVLNAILISVNSNASSKAYDNFTKGDSPPTILNNYINKFKKLQSPFHRFIAYRIQENKINLEVAIRHKKHRDANVLHQNATLGKIGEINNIGFFCKNRNSDYIFLGSSDKKTKDSNNKTTRYYGLTDIDISDFQFNNNFRCIAHIIHKNSDSQAFSNGYGYLDNDMVRGRKIDKR